MQYFYATVNCALTFLLHHSMVFNDGPLELDKVHSNFSMKEPTV